MPVAVSSTPGPQTNTQRHEHLTDRNCVTRKTFPVAVSQLVLTSEDCGSFHFLLTFVESHATPRHLSLWHAFPHWQAAIRSDPVCPCSGLTTACHISGLVRLAAAQCYLHAGQNLSRQLNAHESQSECISDLLLKHLVGFKVPCLRVKCSVPSSESPER